jgi:hypothetical protein
LLGCILVGFEPVDGENDAVHAGDRVARGDRALFEEVCENVAFVLREELPHGRMVHGKYLQSDNSYANPLLNIKFLRV